VSRCKHISEGSIATSRRSLREPPSWAGLALPEPRKAPQFRLGKRLKVTRSVLWPGDLNGLLESTAALERLLQQGDRTRTQVLEREGFMLRAIESLAGYGANLLEMYGKHSPETTDSEAVTGENRRDQVNAENLRWLIDTACADRRIMVWAHNARDERVVREGVRQYRPGASERRDEADRRVARRLVWRGPL